ncbi:DUF6751 family protein [Ruminococcus flavefaciens]|uniref:DUF6751 family protein n=1 Tax=Ruminococcus flavefaciens TaxID=1265 RepID=UPI003F075E80
MLTNADCTVYEKDTYTRHSISDVFWNDSRGATVQKNGIQVSDSVLVYIYDSDYVPKAGDIIVKGKVNFAFTATTQQTISASMKQFRDQYPQFAVVKSVNDARYGGLPHIEVIAR